MALNRNIKGFMKVLDKHGKEKRAYKEGGRAAKWISSAINPKNKGALHKSLGVPQDKKIPETKLKKAEKSKNLLTRRRAILADTLRSFKHEN